MCTRPGARIHTRTAGPGWHFKATAGPLSASTPGTPCLLACSQSPLTTSLGVPSSRKPSWAPSVQQARPGDLGPRLGSAPGPGVTSKPGHPSQGWRLGCLRSRGEGSPETLHPFPHLQGQRQCKHPGRRQEKCQAALNNLLPETRSRRAVAAGTGWDSDQTRLTWEE